MRVVDEVAGDAQRGQLRLAQCLAAVVASVPLLALPAAGTAAAAETPVFDALPSKPSRVLTLSLTYFELDDDLRGTVCEGQRTCISVPYPYLDRAAGVANLDSALRNGTGNHQIVYGFSQGANVAGDWLNEHFRAEDTLSSSALSFVLIGNPGRKYGGSLVNFGQMTPATEYNVLDVSRQYDLSSDVPDDPSNLLAMINAWAGFFAVHTDYETVDIYNPANYVWKEGKTTYVFVPTDRLPMLGFLYSVGLSEIADELDAPLRAEIEKAYDRSYLPAQPGGWPAETELEPEPEEVPAQPEQPAVGGLAKARTAGAEDGSGSSNLLSDGAESQQEPGSEPKPKSINSDADLEDDDPEQFSGLEADPEHIGDLEDDRPERPVDPKHEDPDQPVDLEHDDPERIGDLEDGARESKPDNPVTAVVVPKDSESPQASSGDEASADSDKQLRQPRNPEAPTN